MSTVYGFSEEILLMIFKDLGIEDLRNCQEVCRSWYSPAHVVILKSIDLTNANDIDQFITSIDYNPKPVYLKAVKKITIRNLDITADDAAVEENSNEQVTNTGDETNSTVTIIDNKATDSKVASEVTGEAKYQPPLWHNKGYIKKLFTRFSNLEEVHIIDSLDFLQEFDDELCESILKSCPNLNTFNLTAKNPKEAQTQYCNVLHKVRLLLTIVDPNSITDMSRFGDLQQLLNNFPRLNKIVNCPPQLDTFEKWLPVFERLPNLKDLKVISTVDDQLSFALNYLSTKSKDEHNRLVQKLSAVENLNWTNSSGICLNSVTFIARYLKGLKQLNLNCTFKEQWSNVNQQLFCNVMLGLQEHISDFNVTVKTKTGILAEHLPIILNSTFFRAGAHNNESQRVLEVSVSNSPDLLNSAQVTIVANKSTERLIRITVGNDFSLDNITTTLSGKTFPVEYVDEFRLSIEDDIHYSKKVDTDTYLKLAKGMQYVKTLKLCIPSSYVGSEKTIGNIEELLRVKQLNVDSDMDTNVHTLLDTYSTILPNLRDLDLINFSGIWVQNLSEFQLAMPGYKLETLTINSSFVGIKTLEHLHKKKLQEGDFAVVLVETLDGGERPLYKISFHDFSIARIHNKDLKGFIRGEDYVRIHITIRSLQKLEVFHFNVDTDLWVSKTINIHDA